MLRQLKERSREPELMDDFSGSESELKIIFDDINRVNRLLGGNKITIEAVAKLIDLNPKNSYTLMDVGCGDGTMLRAIADYCRTHSINVALIGIDLNEDALEIARKASVNYHEIRFELQDVLKLTETDLDCDILISTLTTHHFTNEQLPTMLTQFARLSKIGFVNNDLHRSPIAVVLFKLFRRVFIKSKIAKIDGLISICSGFKKRELIELSKQLPQMHHKIKWKWAFRYVWIMQPNRPKST